MELRFFFNDTATTEIYTLSLHDALPISGEWVITISRRYTDAEGQFAGAVVVALGVENFRSEEHTSELQSHLNLVCRLLLEKKKPRHRRSPSPSSRPLPPSPTRGASPTLP